jgi:DNA-binding MarR family transcriptional regulator
MKSTNIHAEATPRNNSRIGAGDWFTRERFRWLDSLAADPKMSPGDFIVGYAIATSLQRNSGNRALVAASNDPDDVVCEAWIGAGEIADKIGMSTGTVFANVRKLEEHDYIQKDPGKPGSGHAHHYRLVEKDQPADHSKGQRADYSEKSKGQPPDYSTPEKVSGLTKKGQPADMNPFVPLKEISIEEIDSSQLDLGDEDSGRRSRDPNSQTETDANLEIWYKEYPKHVDKADARKAYLAVIKKPLATHEQLMAATMRYGAERTGQDPRYTKNPATWLNKQSWLNEPASTGATYSAPPPSGHSHHIDISAAIARQLQERDGSHV